MSRIICIIGNKGGTGKTTLSHMLCQGLGLLGQRSACVLTDTSREPLSPDGRRYVTADARTPEALHKVVGKLRTMQGWIGVIDGGGNRAEVDRTLDGLADIVLLPFRDSHEDLRTVLRDLEAFPTPTPCPPSGPPTPGSATPPTATWPRSSATPHRLLHPVASLSASKLLLQKHIPDGLPSNLGNACRALARQVMEIWRWRAPPRSPHQPAARARRPPSARKLRQHRPSLTPGIAIAFP
jgi:hypothetical protein